MDVKLDCGTLSISSAEAQRAWLSPADLMFVAMTEHDPDARKMLSNISDRGLVPFIKDGRKRTAPRHYSLLSALRFKTIYKHVVRNYGYEDAAMVGEHASFMLLEAIKRFRTLEDFKCTRPGTFLVFQRDWHGQPSIREFTPDSFDITEMIEHAASIFSVVQVFWDMEEVISAYADRWVDSQSDDSLRFPSSIWTPA